MKGFPFKATGRQPIELGWRAAFPEWQPADEKGDGAELLPALRDGEAARLRDPIVETKETKPPPRYSEGTLIEAMQNAWRFVDDALPDSAFEMVAIPGGGGVSIDRFEASRPDSTSGLAGINEAVACSKPNVVPWTGGGFNEASQACSARGPGYRLCTSAESENACRGAGDTDYPYGNGYQQATCNGVDAANGAALPTGSMLACVTPENAFDLSGNIAEWTSTQTNSPTVAPDRIFALAGGSYLSPEIGLACTIDLEPRALESTLLANIGFRCCKDP